MAMTFKIVAPLVATAALVASSIGTAHAFSMAGAADGMQARSQGAVAAYTQEGAVGDGDNSVLSPAEISHIRWCAERYLSYHATDNTYESSAGKRSACVSP
jgi:hypothetical protein